MRDSVRVDRIRRVATPSAFDRNQIIYPELAQLEFLAGERTAEDFWLSGFDTESLDHDRLDRVMAMLPPKWIDVWNMTIQGKSQKQIADVMGWAQPNVVYTIRRTTNALKLLLSLPDISEESIEADLSAHLQPRVVEALKLFYRTSNLTATAEHLGRSGSSSGTYAKRMINSALAKLRQVPSAEPYVEFFEAAMANRLAWCDYKPHVTTRGERQLMEAR